MNEEFKLSLAPMVNMEPMHLPKLEHQPEHSILPFYVSSGGTPAQPYSVDVVEKLPSDYVAVELKTNNQSENKQPKKPESRKRNTDGASSTDYIMCQNGKAIAVHMRKGVPVVYAVSSDTDFPIVNCDYCESTFRNKKCYAWHLRKHHPEMVPKKENKQVVKTAVCNVCNKRFQSNALLKYHYRKHTNEKPIQCPMCDKCFRTPLNFKVHLRTHTGERPYSCPRCPKEFMTKAAINRHERVHTGEKPYECPTCGQRFTQSNSVKLHVNTVHLKMPAPYKRKSKAQLAMQKQMAMAQHLRLPE